MKDFQVQRFLSLTKAITKKSQLSLTFIFCYISFINGTRRTKLVELEPLTVFEDYKIQWRKPKTDLSKLARLYWIEGLSVAQVATELDKSPITIRICIGRLSKPKGLKSVGLVPSELKLIRAKIKTGL